MSIKKGLLFISLCTLSSLNLAHAAPLPLPEWFVGLEGGYADTNFSTGSVKANSTYGGVPVTYASIANHVVAARGYAGYRPSQYFSGEVGYLRIKSTAYNNINYGSIPNGSIAESAVDLRAKAYLPLLSDHRLNPYLQLGIAYMDVNTHGGIVDNASTNYGYSYHPVFGAGIGYDFLPYLTGDISWTSITGRNTNVPRIDLIFLGLTYRFSSHDYVNRAMSNQDSDDRRAPDMDPTI